MLGIVKVKNTFSKITQNNGDYKIKIQGFEKRKVNTIIQQTFSFPVTDALKLLSSLYNNKKKQVHLKNSNFADVHKRGKEDGKIRENYSKGVLRGKFFTLIKFVMQNEEIS